MDTSNLQNLINFIEYNKIKLDDKIKYSIDNSVLSNFVKLNNIDIITCNFLHNNMIDNDEQSPLNKNIITKGKVYPTGIIANFLILLFCMWEDQKYLDIVKIAYSDIMARDYFKNHVREILFITIDNKMWVTFKNYILIFSKKKLSADEYKFFYNAIVSSKNITNFTEKYNQIQNDNFEEKQQEEKLSRLEDKFDKIGKKLF